MKHKGFLTADEIFGNRVAAARFFETILVAEPSPDTRRGDFAVLATDCSRFDLMAIGEQTRVLPRDGFLREAYDAADAELVGQLGMFG